MIGEPIPPHLLHLRNLLSKWEHEEITLEELYEGLEDKFGHKTNNDVLRGVNQ